MTIPGLWAAVIAFALLGGAAVVGALALVTALVLVRRPTGRRRALGALAFAATQALAGAALIGLADHGPLDPTVVDVLSFPLAAASLAAGAYLAWRMARARRRPAPVAPAPAPGAAPGA